MTARDASAMCAVIDRAYKNSNRNFYFVTTIRFDIGDFGRIDSPFNVNSV